MDIVQHTQWCSRMVVYMHMDLTNYGLKPNWKKYEILLEKIEPLADFEPKQWKKMASLQGLNDLIFFKAWGHHWMMWKLGNGRKC